RLLLLEASQIISFNSLKTSRVSHLNLPDEAFASFKNFFDQFGLGRFNVAAQHTFGAGCAKQYPRVGAVAVLGSVEVELHSVAILFAEDGIGAEFRRPRIGGAADGAVL